MCNSTIKSWKIRRKVLDVRSCSVCVTKFSFQIVSFIYCPVAGWICIWMSLWLHYPTYSKDPAMPANYLGIALASCLSKLLELCNLMLFQICSALPTCILGPRGASLLIFVLDYWRLVHPPGIKSSVRSVRHEQSIWLSRSWSTFWATS